jgi:hypothetical protein
MKAIVKKLNTGVTVMQIKHKRNGKNYITIGVIEPKKKFKS